MRLYEEYLQRHQIRIPLVHHCAGVSCVIRVGDRRIWSGFTSSEELAFKLPVHAVLEIRWVHASSRPGEYHISIKSPLHDATQGSGCYSYPYSVVVKWHEYEDSVYRICELLKGARTYQEPHDLLLAIWEMFVYAHDTWFCRQSGDLKYLLYQTLDREVASTQRVSCVQEAVRRIAAVNPVAAKMWRDEFLVHLQQENEWLAGLIGGTCENNILRLR